MPAPTRGEQKKRLRSARGRGNQGDWVFGGVKLDTTKEHDDWNAELEAKRKAKQDAKKKKRGKEI